MANSFGTLNGLVIAQRTLTTLLAKFPLLSKISTNFNNEPLLFGQTLLVNLVAPRTASNYSTVNGYVPTDGAISQVPVVINQHVHDTYQVNDQEASSTNEDLIQKQANVSAYALGRAIYNYLMALVIEANFPNYTVVATPGAMNRSTLIDINQVLDDRFVADLDRFALLNTQYYAGIKKDTVVVSNNQNPAAGTAISSGILPDVDGTMVMKTSAIPNNGQSLVGIVGVAEALALATTIPSAPPKDLPVGGRVSVVSDTNSGVSMQLREWYNFDLGQTRRTSTLMFGGAVGNAATIQRIVTQHA